MQLDQGGGLMPGGRYYQTDQWKALRAACLRRAKARCATPGCAGRATNADHIKPRSAGGADTLANLRALCQACHSRVTRAGNAAALRAVGCDVNGVPHDPGHHWAKARATGG